MVLAANRGRYAGAGMAGMSTGGGAMTISDVFSPLILYVSTTLTEASEFSFSSFALVSGAVVGVRWEDGVRPPLPSRGTGGAERLRPVRNERPLKAGIAIGRSTGVPLTLDERCVGCAGGTGRRLSGRVDSCGAEPLRFKDGMRPGVTYCGGIYEVTSPWRAPSVSNSS